MFLLISGDHIGGPNCSPIWRLHGVFLLRGLQLPFVDLSFDIKKIKSEEKERKKTTENIKLFQLLALITSLCKGANDH